MKVRALTAGLALLATGTVIGVGTQQFASADVSSGDRPVFVPIETCRLADTREAPEFNVGPRNTPLGREDTLIVDAQQAGTDCTGLISTDASALSLNVTVPTATEESFVTIWADGARPDASSLNPQPGQLVFNAVTVDLAADQTFRIFNNRGNSNVIVDVNGYYENHDHDDRYYTQTQVDERDAVAKNVAFSTGDPSTGDYDIDLSLIVPDDYTPGTDPRVEVILVPGLDAPCVVEIAKSYVWAARPGQDGTLPGGFGSNLIENVTPNDLDFNFSGSSVATERLEFTLAVGDIIQAGDSLAFGFFELLGTTCTTGGLLGATLFYE